MKILYSPIVRYPGQPDLIYKIQGKIVQVTYGENSDSFDFSEMPDGELIDIETLLEINPINQAIKKEGELFLTLLNLIDDDEDSENILFPEWQEVQDGEN